jgi:hypothetical protein
MARPGDPDRPVRRRQVGALPIAVVGMLLLALACEPEAGVEPPPPPPPPPLLPAPRILGSAVAPNPANALSAVVTATVWWTDSIAVRYGLAGTALDSITPTIPPLDDTVLVPVLGLLPDSLYALQVVAYGNRQVREGDTLTLRTGALPADLPRYVASGPDPSPGYVVFAAGKYGLVIDNTGRVVWYHRFEYGAGLSFAAQPTGRYVARPATPEPTDHRPWVEVGPLGGVTRTLDCLLGLEPRLHDLIAEPDGSYWLMCDDTRVMDLSALGGLENAWVTGTAVQHVSPEGVLLFRWTPFDHFDIADLDAASRSGSTVNWTHGNSLDLDTDGNVIVSFRNLSEITKIDTRTGDVLWRMGGVRNQFTFAGTPAPAFSRQHGLRLTSVGRLVLLDNLGDPLDTRAERYVFDPEALTARQVASLGSAPAVTVQLGGSVQDLPGDRTLVSFGTAGRVQEYDAAGNVVWQIEGNAGYVFRAQRIRSLYRPGVGLPR